MYNILLYSEGNLTYLNFTEYNMLWLGVDRNGTFCQCLTYSVGLTCILQLILVGALTEMALFCLPLSANAQEHNGTVGDKAMSFLTRHQRL